MMKDIANFLSKVRHWAEAQKDIQAIFLVGSYARGQAHEDSDIDLVILTEEPDKYLNDYAFIDNFGAPKEIKKEFWGRVTSLRVWYQESDEVELGITTPDWITEDPLDAGTRRVISDGAKIVFDRIGDLDQLIRQVQKGI